MALATTLLATGTAVSGDGAVPHAVHYLPILTTVLAAFFAVVLFRHWRSKPQGLHLLWWALGMVTYGLGTGLESSITLFGNTAELTKAWYVAGAFLGGYPLAQGSLYLLAKRRTAHWLTLLTVPPIAVLSVLVFLSPVHVEALEAFRPSGAVLGWSWLRWATPFVNLYAVVFLIGGAAVSAWRYFRSHTERAELGAKNRAIGNALIAFGALLPGIGGGMAKAGIVEGLYVGELVGLLFIWAGYRYCVARPIPVTGKASADAPGQGEPVSDRRAAAAAG